MVVLPRHATERVSRRHCAYAEKACALARRTVIGSVICLAACALILGAAAGLMAAEKGYPSRQIQLVIPFPAGGSLDILVRAINDELTKNFGVPTIIVNKGGGSATVGTEYAARSAPDGYTLLVGNNAIFVTVPLTEKGLPYKNSDFIPIARFGFTPMFCLLKNDAPWKNFDELLAYAKKNPGKLTCATSGAASLGRFCLEHVNVEAGTNIRNVPFKGGPPANTATLGGHVSMLISSVSAVTGLIKSGDLRPILNFSEKRSPAYPNVPTSVEKGFPDSSMVLWTGLFAPKGTDKSIIDLISRTVEKTVNTPSVIKKIVESDNEHEFIPGDRFGQELDKEYKATVDVIKKAHMTF